MILCWSHRPTTTRLVPQRSFERVPACNLGTWVDVFSEWLEKMEKAGQNPPVKRSTNEALTTPILKIHVLAAQIYMKQG